MNSQLLEPFRASALIDYMTLQYPIMPSSINLVILRIEISLDSFRLTFAENGDGADIVIPTRAHESYH